jgi:hypothetical protein
MNQMRRYLSLYKLMAVLCLASPALASSFVIDVNFGNGLTLSQQSLFSAAANKWMSLLPAYRPGINISPLVITASGVSIDGVGGTLGSAGPDSVVSRAGFWLAANGSMQFDTADLNQMEANGTLSSVILHEMAHVMGFGTLWELNNVYVDGTGRYTGANALAAYRTEFNQPGATFVPVELGGGSGTANGHWDEVDNGAGNTGRVSALGDIRFELMTGWLNTPSYISETTVQSFVDIGFVTAVPEPTTLLSLASGALLLVFFKRRS